MSQVVPEAIVNRDQIITSALDNDLYNFHMGDFAFHKYYDAEVKYSYLCRDSSLDLIQILPQFREQLDMIADLTITEDEAEFLVKNTQVSEAYADHLLNTKIFDPSDIEINEYSHTFSLASTGRWCDRIYREVTCMSMISELFFRNMYGDDYDVVLESGKQRLKEIILWCKGDAHKLFTFMEFGTRRRFSYEWHKYVLEQLWSELQGIIVGTSNVHMAHTMNIPCHGTMAHQLFMFMQTTTHLGDSQTKTLNEWNEHFDGKLGNALTDTLGDYKWDTDFTAIQMAKYNCERNDSGNPARWGVMRLDAAEEKGIDPLTRSIQFSNDLSAPSASKLNEYFENKCIVAPHGMGTFWTGKMGYPGQKHVNHVMKLTWAKPTPESEWRATCKLSADAAKAQCESHDVLVYAKYIAQPQSEVI